MDAMACLKTFNTEELLNLLRDCANNLALAYQEIHEKALYLTSEEAYQACDYLMYEIKKRQPNHVVH